MFAAVSGHWDPDAPFMLFTGYIDESDTHQRTPNITMSAMLSTAGRWERCDRAYARLRQRFGFSVFHATEFRALQGEFANWSEQMCVSLLEGMGKLTFNHLTECFVIHCKHSVYKEHFLDKKPPRMHRISQYGICFSVAMDAMIRRLLREGIQHKLSIIVEQGHRNAAETGQLFKELKQRLDDKGADILLPHTLASKKEIPVLGLADITAHGHTLERRAVDRGQIPPFAEQGVIAADDPQLGWNILEVTPEYLAMVIDEYNQARAAAAEDYLRRKQAWQAAKAGDGRPE
jgi:hypothetical protein